MDSLPPPFAGHPASGRVFLTRRIVRSTDVAPSGRLRLDSVARYLQAAAEDDVADAGLAEPVGWLLRRSKLSIASLPRAGTRLSIRTFCSGTGPRWAERTTTLSDGGRDLVEARAVWAAVGIADGRPVPLSENFLRIYGPSASGRTVSARLSHRPPEGEAADGRPWPLRAADYDEAGHVNNAVPWAAVEDELAVRGWVPAVAEMEYYRAILPGCNPVLVTDGTDGRDRATFIWLMSDGLLLAAARLARSTSGSRVS
jgi:acyl-ACP thioesterase